MYEASLQRRHGSVLLIVAADPLPPNRFENVASERHSRVGVQQHLGVDVTNGTSEAAEGKCPRLPDRLALGHQRKRQGVASMEPTLLSRSALPVNVNHRPLNGNGRPWLKEPVAGCQSSQSTARNTSTWTP